MKFQLAPELIKTRTAKGVLIILPGSPWLFWTSKKFLDDNLILNFPKTWKIQLIKATAQYKVIEKNEIYAEELRKFLKEI